MKTTLSSLAVMLVLAACSQPQGSSSGSGSAAGPPAGFGDPVGIKLAGAPGLPTAIEIRVALSKDRDPDPLVKPIAQALLTGLRACPAFVEAGKNGATPSLAFHVEGGKIASGSSDEAAAKCVIDAMRGAEVGDAKAAPFDALAAVLFGSENAAK